MKTFLSLATSHPEKNRKALEHAAKLRHNSNFDHSIRTGRRNLLLITILFVFLIINIVKPTLSQALETILEISK
jgi:hypothetical protein